jgi:thymidylate synthase
MTATFFPGKTLDDVMRSVVDAIQTHGDAIMPSKGPATELRGVLLEITNPRARLSRTETRGKLYSALGELCWYLAKTNAVGFIEYYIPTYSESADGDEIFGGYGPRLFSWKGLNQVDNVIAILRKKPHSRQAVIQLFEANDIVGGHKDIPCTCTLQLMNRHDELHMFVNMRSNDVHWGLPHDVFCFTMLQEIMARSLSIELGTYKHAVGSLHLYKKHDAAAKRFLKEGWQATTPPMPPMPTGDPWQSISVLIQAEETIRLQGATDGTKLSDLDPYWADLIRLLQAFRAYKDRDTSKTRAVRAAMSSRTYFPFIDRLDRKLEASTPVSSGE